MLRQIPLGEDAEAVHPLTNENTASSLRVSRSRLPSLSSLLGSAENIKEEKMGFRRLAKSLLHNESKNVTASKGTDLDEVVQCAIDEDRESLRYYETAKNYSLSSSKVNRKLAGETRGNVSRQSQASRQQTDSCEKEETLLARLMETNLKIRQETRKASKNSTITRDSEPEEAGDSRGSGSKQLGMGRKTGSVGADNNALKMNENIVNTTFHLDRQVTKDGILDAIMRESRVVMLSNIHRNTSLTSIMSQIYGGPLEKVLLLDKSSLKEKQYDLGNQINWDETLLHLYFQREEDALKFMNFASTGMFVVNGYHLHPSWIPRSGIVNTEDYLCYHEKDSLQSLEMMGGSESARRVLVLKKPVLAKSKLNSHITSEKKRPSYPDPILNYSPDFDLNAIRTDFSQFGPIVEILPVVSRKLCFAVQYFDVQAAVAAKHAIQAKGSVSDNQMSVKYKDWYIWYGRDPADKAALFV
ncbi:hypothetical protein KL938_000802 [Ogataea parapolymorpha]|nr:hypothetical protein KL938_000802 [Ogataea parapolymorpha]